MLDPYPPLTYGRDLQFGVPQHAKGLARTMNAADYFMICFVFAAYAIGPLLAALLVRRIYKSSLFDHSDK